MKHILLFFTITLLFITTPSMSQEDSVVTSPLTNSVKETGSEVEDLSKPSKDQHWYVKLFDSFSKEDIFQIVTLIIAFWSGIMASWTTYITYKISKSNFFQSKVDSEGQMDILSDIVRHIYRNKIVIISMIAKYKYYSSSSPGTVFYPAEDHYRKLCLLDDDLYVHQYNRNDTFYHIMHQIYLNIRNLNHEIEAAIIHTKEAKYNIHTVRDLQNIDFKLTLINDLIIKLIIDRYIENERNKRKVTKKIWQWIGVKFFRYDKNVDYDKLRAEAIKTYVIEKIEQSQVGSSQSNPISGIHGHIYKDDIIKTMSKLFSDNNKYCKDSNISSLCVINSPCNNIEYCHSICPIYKDCLIECGKSVTGYDKILIIEK